MNRYIEHIIKDMVRDTIIDYDNKTLTFPFLPSSTLISLNLLNLRLLSPIFFPFSKYSKHTYGLTKPEIEYVWKEYTNIIRDKIRNER